MNKEYTLIIILFEYFFSFSLRAGETNRNNSYIIYGDAHNKPKYIEVVRCVTNWLETSVAIRLILKDSNWNIGLKFLIKLPTARYVTKEESPGPKRISNVIALSQKIIHAKTNVTPKIRNNICRKTSRCPPKDISSSLSVMLYLVRFRFVYSILVISID